MAEARSMETPTISIAIPTYNRAGMLRKVMESLIHQKTGGGFSYEVLVIDDASTDETREVVLETSKSSPVPIRYVLGQGKGYTYALNSAVAEYQGEWLGFLDDDELAEPDWLRNLYSFAKEADAHIMGGRCALEILGGEGMALGPVYRSMLGELPFYGNERECRTKFLPGGGNMLVRREVFDSIGDFDRTILTGGCDRDFILRAGAAGFRVGRTPEAVIRHLIPAYRVTPEFMRWYSLQWGCSFAFIDWKRWSPWKTLIACLARIGQAILVNLPLLLIGHLKHDRTGISDRKALLWGAVGYTRKTLFLLAPRFFAQERFFYRLEFRRERETFSKKQK